jgi:hypothetical protein
MSINLEKGQKVDLTKSNPGINSYALGLGWSENANVGSAFDLDASAFILGANKKRLSDKHFVFYGTLEENEKAVSEEEKKAIIDAAAELEEVLKNENATKEEIEAKLKTLTEKSHKLAEAMYKKEGGEAGAQPNQKAKKDDDDVIDAEVE